MSSTLAELPREIHSRSERMETQTTEAEAEAAASPPASSAAHSSASSLAFQLFYIDHRATSLADTGRSRPSLVASRSNTGSRLLQARYQSSSTKILLVFLAIDTSNVGVALGGPFISFSSDLEPLGSALKV